jgi:hypothetical protein
MARGYLGNEKIVSGRSNGKAGPYCGQLSPSSHHHTSHYEWNDAAMDAQLAAILNATQE